MRTDRQKRIKVALGLAVSSGPRSDSWSHSMTTRTTTKGVTFRRPFHLKGVDRLLPPAEYSVVTDEEVLDGLSFVAYRRVSTVIFVPAEFWICRRDGHHRSLDLQAAQEQDASALSEYTHLASVRATQEKPSQ